MRVTGNDGLASTRTLTLRVVAPPPPPVPGAFGKTAPKNASRGIVSTTTLSWGASSGAASYAYCYDTTNDGVCAGSWLTTGTARQVAISGLARDTTYYWQVRAQNAGGTTTADKGTWWKFTTAR